MTDRPPAPSILFLFTFTDGQQEVRLSTYPTDERVRELLRLLEKEESPVTPGKVNLS